jgi:hypothetical protein
MTAFEANALWLASGRRTMNDANWTTADRAPRRPPMFGIRHGRDDRN